MEVLNRAVDLTFLPVKSLSWRSRGADPESERVEFIKKPPLAGCLPSNFLLSIMPHHFIPSLSSHFRGSFLWSHVLPIEMFDGKACYL